MKPITVVGPVGSEADSNELARLSSNALVEKIISLVTDPRMRAGVGASLAAESLFSGTLIARIIEECTSDYLLLILPGERLLWTERALSRLADVAADSGAGLVYSDYRDQIGEQLSDHPLIDYQTGSIRDNFDFGGALFISKKTASVALNSGPGGLTLKWGGLYDLRLRLSEKAPVVHLPEPLYVRMISDDRTSGERLFDYVNPTKRDYQKEMELIATEHLRRIGALLGSDFRKVLPAPSNTFPVVASVVIPVRNRVSTITEAVESALSQETTFPFNVIAVDNHSTDGTSHEISRLAASDPRLVHVIPQRLDLGIGGCWNEAIYSPSCGRYAVQLDSDDLYSGKDTLARVIDAFRSGSHAMVIGSYKTVDFELNELPPGLVDHREWTRENGRNNALRINGLGAPRAFDISVLRGIGLPNVSYGEDYAVALRLSREYEIGRIYEVLYLARRWRGNSDSALPLATMNRYDHYKDWIRTNEIKARQQLNLSG